MEGAWCRGTLEEAEDGESRSRPAWSTPTFKTRLVWVDKMTEWVKSLPHKPNNPTCIFTKKHVKLAEEQTQPYKAVSLASTRVHDTSRYTHNVHTYIIIVINNDDNDNKFKTFFQTQLLNSW